MSPEVVMGDYDEKCDIWSAGVILYILLGGDPPFQALSEYEIYQKIEKMEYSFPSQPWDKISQEAKDLISNMLCHHDKRMTAKEVLSHKWLADRLSPESKTLPTDIINNIKKYSSYNKIKKAVLTYIAARLNDSEIKSLREIFQKIDINNDGTITMDEFKKGFSYLNDEILEDIFRSIDTDKSNAINYTEFLASTIDQRIYFQEDKLISAFGLFDKNGNGKISKNEMKEILNVTQEDEHKIEEIFKSIDINDDGEIDFNEFLILMGK